MRYTFYWNIFSKRKYIVKLHEEPNITEVVASFIAIIAIIATIYAALFNDSEQAQVALVGLTGAVSSYFLTPKYNGDRGKKDKTTDPPDNQETTKFPDVISDRP